MLKPLKTLGAIAVLVAAVMTGSGPAAVAQDKVKVGVFPTASSLPYFVAIERGFFKEQNIEPETIRLIGGPPNIAAMISNQIEAAIVLVTIEAKNDAGSTTQAFTVATNDVVIAPHASWKYLDTGSDQGSAWRIPGARPRAIRRKPLRQLLIETHARLSAPLALPSQQIRAFDKGARTRRPSRTSLGTRLVPM